MIINFKPSGGDNYVDSSYCGCVDTRELIFKVKGEAESVTAIDVLADLLKYEALWNIDLFWGNRTGVFELGPFTLAIETTDFEELSFDQLSKRLIEYAEDPSWGDADTSVYLRLTRRILNWIGMVGPEKLKILYANADAIPVTKKIDPELDFFGYYISIVLIDLADHRVWVLGLGQD